MDAGQFDRRVTLQRKGTAVDDGLQTVQGDFAPLASVWAQFIPLTSSERAAASETLAFQKANWQIRKDSAWADLNAKDRLIDPDGRSFDIINVTEPKRGYLFIESVSAGDA